MSIIKGGCGAEVDVEGQGVRRGLVGGGGGRQGYSNFFFFLLFSLIQYKRTLLFIINACDKQLPFGSLEFHKKVKQTVQHKRGNSIQMKSIIRSKM